MTIPTRNINGVFTIHTAKEKRESLHKKVFGTSEGVENLWKDSLNNLPKSNHAVVLGICSDTGGGILRGANWGPLFLREALLKNETVKGNMPYFDLGDVRVIPHLLHDKYLNEGYYPADTNNKEFLDGWGSSFKTEDVKKNAMEILNDIL